MSILSYKGKEPSVGKDCFVADTSTIVGDVVLGEESSVWFGVSIRAEVDSVRIGNRSNVQDNSVIHVDEGFPCLMGDGVTNGHRAINLGPMDGSH